MAGLDIVGRVAAPGDADWDASRLAWNLSAEQQPAAVAFVENADDVARVVRFAAKHELKVLGQSTGHGATPLGALEDTIVIKTERMRAIAVDRDTGTAHMQAGVLALELALVPVSELYAGTLILPAEAGAPAIRAYREWAAGAPEEVTSVVRFLRPPPLPDVPEPLRGRALLTIGVACIGSEANGVEAVAALREIGEPIMDLIGQRPVAGLSKIHMDPEHPVPARGHHAPIRELPDAAIDAFVAAAGPESGSPLLSAELRQLGGALSRPAPEHGALSALDASFLMFGVGMVMTPQAGQAVERGLDNLNDAMQPWAADGGYLNFAERPCDVDALMPPQTCARLREIKLRWDPAELIRANHAVSIATA